MSIARYSPMAGAEVRPGDSMHAASKKPSAVSPIIKSSDPCARSPENPVIVLLYGIPGTL